MIQPPSEKTRKNNGRVGVQNVEGPGGKNIRHRFLQAYSEVADALGQVENVALGDSVVPGFSLGGKPNQVGDIYLAIRLYVPHLNEEVGPIGGVFDPPKGLISSPDLRDRPKREGAARRVGVVCMLHTTMSVLRLNQKVNSQYEAY